MCCAAAAAAAAAATCSFIHSQFPSPISHQATLSNLVLVLYFVCGYMAPEYAMDGHFLEKSDVYSFGVLLLEILTAQKNNAFWYEEESLTLLGYVWKLWAEGDAGSIIDPLIYDPLSKKEIDRSIVVGLLCVQENVNDRPNMSTVMSMFSSDMANLPQPKEPGFNKRHMFMDTISSNLNQMSGEPISMTAISGR